MTDDEKRPNGTQSARQFAEDLRDTVGKRVADNESSLRSGLGRAARWFDRRTGGKYSEQIGRAESKVGEGIGWAASQGAPEAPAPTDPDPRPGPGAPGAAAGDPAPRAVPDDQPTGPVRPAPDLGRDRPDPRRPAESPFARPAGPGEGDVGPGRPPQDPPTRPH